LVFVDRRTLNELVAELRLAFTQLELPATVQPGPVHDDGPGELVVEADRGRWRLAVTTRADLRPAQARELPAIGAGETGGIGGSGGIGGTGAADEARATGVAGRAAGGSNDGFDAGVVFADRLAERTRDVLRERGWGWLDRRRGHLRIWVPGLRLDAPVTPSAAPSAAGLPPAKMRVRDPFSPSGVTLALWLLLHPHDAASPREIARQTSISPGQVSNLLGALSAESLLRRDRTPLVPELFWALVEHWRPRRQALASLPPMTELTAAPELHARSWVLSETRAAAVYGAPIVAGADHPPDLYLPDERSLAWLLGRAVVAPDFAQRVATVAVTPTALVCQARFRRRDTAEAWPLAHPVVVALDLAVDRHRGREAVEQWDPDPSLEVERVW
jgi:hypothetical protein